MRPGFFLLALMGQVAAMMQRSMCKSKIHRATVTHADINYQGSVTIDAELMERADILEYEAVHVWNITNGERFVTYAIAGAPNSGVVCINGAAARLVAPGDKVIIATFAELDEITARNHHLKVVFVDERNRLVAGEQKETAGPRTVAV